MGEWRITLENENNRTSNSLSGTFLFEPINEKPLQATPGRTTSLLIRRKFIGDILRLLARCQIISWWVNTFWFSSFIINLISDCDIQNIGLHSVNSSKYAVRYQGSNGTNWIKGAKHSTKHNSKKVLFPMNNGRVFNQSWILLVSDFSVSNGFI